MEIQEAIVLMHEADILMSCSNINVARDSYLRAANIMYDLARKSTNSYEVFRLVYSAAIAYYQGGYYQEALISFSSLNINYAPTHKIKEKVKSFLSGLKLRQGNEQLWNKIVSLQKNGNKESLFEALDMLIDNPYVSSAINVTKKRIEILESLNMKEEAAEFLKDLKNLT